MHKNNFITVNNQIKERAQTKTLTRPKDDIYSAYELFDSHVTVWRDMW